MGGRWLEAKKYKRCRESPIFQGRVDSGLRGRGPRELAVPVGKGTDSGQATDLVAQVSFTAAHRPRTSGEFLYPSS